MLEKVLRVKGLSYYNYCWNLQHKNAKVVQGSSPDVVGDVAILIVVKSHINDNNTSISLPDSTLDRTSQQNTYTRT